MNFKCITYVYNYDIKKIRSFSILENFPDHDSVDEKYYAHSHDFQCLEYVVEQEYVEQELDWRLQVVVDCDSASFVVLDCYLPEYLVHQCENCGSYNQHVVIPLEVGYEIKILSSCHDNTIDSGLEQAMIEGSCVRTDAFHSS